MFELIEHASMSSRSHGFDVNYGEIICAGDRRNDT